MTKKVCAEECRATAQKLKIICPSKKQEKIFIVTGNWKMNGDKKMAEELIRILRYGHIEQGNEVIIAVPAPYLDYVQQRKPKFVEIAAQNIYKEEKGAYTGEISADMLIDLGITSVVLGAAERRVYFNEDYDLIGEKAKIALEKGLRVILCVGETATDRDSNEYIQAIHKQLQIVSDHVDKSKWKKMIIAYEPLWGILRSSWTASTNEAEEVASAIRNWVRENIDDETAELIKIQYGGPLTSESAKDLASKKDINGFYVGAPSLRRDFLAFINANSKNG